MAGKNGHQDRPPITDLTHMKELCLDCSFCESNITTFAFCSDVISFTRVKTSAHGSSNILCRPIDNVPSKTATIEVGLDIKDESLSDHI